MKTHIYAKLWRTAQKTLAGCFLLAGLSPLNTSAQALAEWNPDTLTNYGPSPWAPFNLDAHTTCGGLTRGALVDITGPAADSAWGGHGWTGTAGSDFSFTLEALTGYKLNIDSLDISLMRDATGTQQSRVEYSVGGGPYNLAYYIGIVSTDPGGGGIPTLDLTAFADLHNVYTGTTVTFRITPDPSIGSSGNGPLHIFNSPVHQNNCKGLSVYGSSAVACQLTTGHSVTNVTGTTADIDWNDVPGAIGYEYVISPVSVFPPSGWTFIVPSNVSLTGLTPDNVNYFYVRAVCDTGIYSNYTTVFVNTPEITGLAALENKIQLTAYPNPTSNFITVAIAGTGTNAGALQLTDITGKIIQTLPVNAGEMQVNMSGYENGIYYLSYTGAHGRSVISVVKQ